MHIISQVIVFNINYMINLEQLQERIDVLLDSETTDSLTNWLFSKRFPEINIIVGEGEFVSLSNTSRCDNIEFVQELEPNSESSANAILEVNSLMYYKLAS